MYIAHAVPVSKSGFIFVLFVTLLQYVDMQYNTNPATVTIEEESKGVSVPMCRLKPDDGPCRGRISMYYFDPLSGDCNTFIWGGCQGNGNRFDSKRQCENTCLKDLRKQGRPKWCSLNFDYGYCFGALKRYYYDHLWQVCKERVYSGCGGNRNNFYSFEQCEAVCIFGNGKISTPKKYTGLSKEVIDPLTTSTRKRTTKRGT